MGEEEKQKGKVVWESGHHQLLRVSGTESPGQHHARH